MHARTHTHTHTHNIHEAREQRVYLETARQSHKYLRNLQWRLLVGKILNISDTETDTTFLVYVTDDLIYKRKRESECNAYKSVLFLAHHELFIVTVQRACMKNLKNNFKKVGLILLPDNEYLQTVITASADAFLHILLCELQGEDMALKRSERSSNLRRASTA